MKITKLVTKAKQFLTPEMNLELKTLIKQNPHMQSAFIRRFFTDPFRKISKDAPVYTKGHAPKQLVIGKHDIGEFHMNDRIDAKKLSPREAVALMNETFDKADHGVAARIGESVNDAHYGLSASSAPLFLNYGLKLQRKGLGNFVKPLGEPEMVYPNHVAGWIEDYYGNLHSLDQKFLDQVNKHVKDINALGYNFPLARVEGKQYLIPNIGFLKYKNGGSINDHIELLQKRNSLVRKSSTHTRS